jgi:hypothetical protein
MNAINHRLGFLLAALLSFSILPTTGYAETGFRTLMGKLNFANFPSVSAYVVIRNESPITESFPKCCYTQQTRKQFSDNCFNISMREISADVPIEKVRIVESLSGMDVVEVIFRSKLPKNTRRFTHCIHIERQEWTNDDDCFLSEVREEGTSALLLAGQSFSIEPETVAKLSPYLSEQALSGKFDTLKNVASEDWEREIERARISLTPNSGAKGVLCEKTWQQSLVDSRADSCEDAVSDRLDAVESVEITKTLSLNKDTKIHLAVLHDVCPQAGLGGNPILYYVLVQTKGFVFYHLLAFQIMEGRTYQSFDPGKLAIVKRAEGGVLYFWAEYIETDLSMSAESEDEGESQMVFNSIYRFVPEAGINLLMDNLEVMRISSSCASDTSGNKCRRAFEAKRRSIQKHTLKTLGIEMKKPGVITIKKVKDRRVVIDAKWYGVHDCNQDCLLMHRD